MKEKMERFYLILKECFIDVFKGYMIVSAVFLSIALYQFILNNFTTLCNWIDVCATTIFNIKIEADIFLNILITLLYTFCFAVSPLLVQLVYFILCKSDGVKNDLSLRKKDKNTGFFASFLIILYLILFTDINLDYNILSAIVFYLLS